mgnify:FL=1
MKLLSRILKQTLILPILISVSSNVLAASPWLPAPQSGTASISYLYATADELYAGNQRSPLPTDLEQHNVLFSLDYGITDRLAAGVSLGYAQSNFIAVPGLSPSANLDGLIDPRVDVRYKLWDELEDGGATFTLHTAGIFNGGYRTGALNSIGDGAFGVEFSGIAGKTWENGLGLSAEIGYRIRTSETANVPNEWFSNVNAFYSLAPLFSIPVTVNFGYRMVDALSGIDIGAPGFAPARFPETQEDLHIVSGGLGYSFGNGVAVNANYGQVIDGRNTANSQLVSFGFTYGF